MHSKHKEANADQADQPSRASRARESYEAKRIDETSSELLTVEQAAHYLQLSTSSIRSYIRDGRLKAFRVAGLRKVLIPRPELLRLLEPT